MESLLTAFLNDHTATLTTIAAAGITHAAASMFTAFTQTPSKRKRWGKIYRWIEFVALNVNKAKQNNYT